MQEAGANRRGSGATGEKLIPHRAEVGHSGAWGGSELGHGAAERRVGEGMKDRRQPKEKKANCRSATATRKMSVMKGKQEDQEELCESDGCPGGHGRPECRLTWKDLVLNKLKPK
ncbi:hypothetical protein NDU88_007228 [Pleurodeles waltl]|uniref:Uncharacterized protein n=1 Tax=Pleurodeles waltl TaxID=8319 RepID=A0AAV7UNA7_PLEWA|nr:hypothetical protein NDU88_007228 [Pleurodeles waltl]